MDYKNLYIKYKTLYLEQKNKKGGYKRNKKLKINIVDEHHHALNHIYKNNKLKKAKLLHFDSHPDMGLDMDLNNKRDIKKLFNNKLSIKNIIKKNEIGTWIPNLIASGMINEVIWISGYWCHQFRSGTYDFILGIDKKTGLMKIASLGNKKSYALEYFNYENLVTKEENLIMKINWKLHVIKFDNEGNLEINKMKKIKNILKNNKWILDIDEDYLSTNNPHYIEFRSMFGKKMYNLLQEVFDVDVDNYYKYNNYLKKVIIQKIYNNKDYLKNNTVKKIFELLHIKYTKKESLDILNKFQIICKNIFYKTKKNKWSTDDIYDHNMILDTGNMVGVPHHISSLKTIIKMINETFDLLKYINSDPEVITVATSRLDRYTPEDQADIINNLLLTMLQECWYKSKIYRYDLKEFSTDSFTKL